MFLSKRHVWKSVKAKSWYADRPWKILQQGSFIASVFPTSDEKGRLTRRLDWFDFLANYQPMHECSSCILKLMHSCLFYLVLKFSLKHNRCIFFYVITVHINHNILNWIENRSRTIYSVCSIQLFTFHNSCRCWSHILFLISRTYITNHSYPFW